MLQLEHMCTDTNTAHLSQVLPSWGRISKPSLSLALGNHQFLPLSRVFTFLFYNHVCFLGELHLIKGGHS